MIPDIHYFSSFFLFSHEQTLEAYRTLREGFHCVGETSVKDAGTTKRGVRKKLVGVEVADNKRKWEAG